MRDPHRGKRPFWHWRRRRDQLAAEIDDELRLHLDLRVEELVRQGLPPEAARREALQQFGDLEYTRRYCRRQDGMKETHTRRGFAVEEVAQDLRISLRSLLRAPVMTLTILTTVGLGIGATTAMFAAVDAAILRPLPYKDPAQLVRIYTDAPPNKFRFSVADYLALEAQQTHFERVAAYTDRPLTFTDGTVAERVWVREVTPAYFALLGIGPVLGRGFSEGDGQPGRPPLVVLSHAFWQRRLGARRDIIGSAVRLDGRDHVLVGVLPAQTGPLGQQTELFVASQFTTPPRKGPFLYTVLGRLRRTADRDAAAAELRAINRRIFPLWRSSYQDDRATWSMMDLQAYVVGESRTTTHVALGAVVLVWLIACANASNLLVARVIGRRRELAIRAAIGASRARIVRYLLAESALLAAGAAAVGAALAWAGVILLRDAGATYLPRAREINMDAHALGLLGVLTVSSALLFGLVPALHASKKPLDDTLRSHGRSSSGSLAVQRLRGVLVGTQFAIATPLLMVAALLLASLQQLARVDLGFDTRHLLSGAISVPAARYPEPGRVAAFFDELRRRVAALPGVSGVAFTDGRPPDDVGNFNNFNLEDSPTPPGQSQPVAPWVSVSPEYFGLLGLTLLDGRTLEETDARRPELEAVVVDRAWARRFFPNRRAVGRRFREGGCTTCPWTTVVGVVSDVKYAGLNRPDEGAVYWPMPLDSRDRFLVVRTAADPATMIPSVRQVVRRLDPEIPLSGVTTIDDLVAQSLEQPRSLTALVGGFAIVALLLSVVGVYGVMAYYVEHHARDISIRLVLGGTPRAVLQVIVGRGMAVVLGGVALGVLASLVLTRSVSSLLFGVGAVDPPIFVVVTAGLLALAVLACLVAAGRAIGADPAAVLRTE
jgi:putative ABC transport system permease protein